MSSNASIATTDQAGRAAIYLRISQDREMDGLAIERQLEDWLDWAEERGLQLVTANGDADLGTDGGRMYARIKAAVARAEMERKSARQRRAHVQRASQGRPWAESTVLGILWNPRYAGFSVYTDIRDRKRAKQANAEKKAELEAQKAEPVKTVRGKRREWRDFEQRGADIVHSLRKQVTSVRKIVESVKTDAGKAPAQLEAGAADWRGAAERIDDIRKRIAAMQQIPGWSGAASGGYTRRSMVQAAATSQLQSLVDDCLASPQLLRPDSWPTGGAQAGTAPAATDTVPDPDEGMRVDDPSTQSASNPRDGIGRNE
ncbi:recombinase family protein [Bowdeniella massiliensis]|uniref:recombinase family protein n=1 Tax=Bowdeniella massiliensis TaxID=2932264 RepID=UPI00202940DC|nr:recombinase family protein [Bowdeniella massiliensis]